MAEYLEKEATGKEKFVINRAFDAPLELVFEMWTNPKHFSQWLAPAGFKMEFIRSDIKPGGSTFYFMAGENTAKMYGRAHYLTIEKPNSIVYTQQFCDEHENLSRHPMVPTWPETMLTTVKLTEEELNRTRVTITWEPYGNVTQEELNVFIQSRGNMTQGWTGSLDKLETYLT
ncbi:MAG: SRPBCC domain-containing protein [Pseudomonadota bacterium]